MFWIHRQKDEGLIIDERIEVFVLHTDNSRALIAVRAPKGMAVRGIESAESAGKTTRYQELDLEVSDGSR